jgi:hypothetical protein
MNNERLFKLAETANDAELVWLFRTIGGNGELTCDGDVSTIIRFTDLYSERLLSTMKEWNKQGLDLEEMIESSKTITKLGHSEWSLNF